MNSTNDSFYGSIPQATIDALDRYVKKGIPTGGFLHAVLSNNLFAAIGRADSGNRANLDKICIYVCSELPNACFGTPEIVESWLKKHDEARANHAQLSLGGVNEDDLDSR